MNESDRMELSPYDRWPGKRGQPLIELLVVMLIFTILSVAMLPVLTPYIVKAQYAAEAMPTMGMIRTKIALFQYEWEQLPGVGLSTDGDSLGTSQLTPDLSRVQTVSSNHAAFSSDFSKTVTVNHTNHILWQIEVGSDDLFGRRLRPQHFQYRVDAATSNRSLFAAGVLGDGQGYEAGTGYAVLEWQTVGKDGERTGAIWKRWQSKAKPPRQVILVSADEAKEFFDCRSAKQALEKDICWIGNPEALLSSDVAVRDRAKAELREAGWEIIGEPPVPWYRKRTLVLWAIPFVLYYVVVLALLLLERPFNWKCGFKLFLWLAVLAWSLPRSPFAPMGWLIGAWMLFAIGSWLCNLCVKVFVWGVRRFRRKEGACE